MMDSSTISEIVKKYYVVSETDDTEYSMAFHIKSPGNEKTFGDLLDELNVIGATAFTNKFPDNQIIVISNSKISREKNGLKVLMVFLSIATIIYSGFVYYSTYSSSDLLYRNILYGTLFYALPVIFILLFRESGKYLALRKNHIKYNFPIFIPSPGIGTLGTINSNKNQFRNQKSMIEAGTFSLLFGFLASILFIIIGAAAMPYVQYNASIHSPISILDFPLVFPLFLDHLFPAFIIPDPLELAGYVGLVTTALNAMPVGFMDGGLVFSAIMGKQFKYASFAGIVILLAASIIYPFILILVVISILLGFRGPLPMNNFFRPRASVKWWALAIVVIILLLGFAPLPLHNTSSSNVSIPDSTYILQQNNTENVTVNVTVQDKGINISPVFSVSPGTFVVEGSTHHNKTTTIYALELITYKSNYSGMQTFNITVNTGTSSFHKIISVYFLKADKNIHIKTISNTSNPANLTEYAGIPFDINITNNGTEAFEAHIIPIFNYTGIYSPLGPGTMLNLSAYSPNGISLEIPGGSNGTLRLEVYKPGNLKLLIMEQGIMAIVVDIHVNPNPNISTPPGHFLPGNYTENCYLPLNACHSFYNF